MCFHGMAALLNCVTCLVRCLAAILRRNKTYVLVFQPNKYIFNNLKYIGMIYINVGEMCFIWMNVHD